MQLGKTNRKLILQGLIGSLVLLSTLHYSESFTKPTLTQDVLMKGICRCFITRQVLYERQVNLSQAKYRKTRYYNPWETAVAAITVRNSTKLNDTVKNHHDENPLRAMIMTFNQTCQNEGDFVHSRSIRWSI